MALRLNNTVFILKNGSFTSQEFIPPGTGSIFRVTGILPESGSLTYTNTNYRLQSTPNLNTGSLPYYILTLSGSLGDGLYSASFLGSTFLAYINTFITASTTGSTPFTESLITTPGSGNWTKPAGVTQVVVECWGGGGAGGGSTLTNGGGGGGAGGQYARKFIEYGTASISIPYNVAASVAGTTGNGSNGNDTTWDTNVVIAKGGGGGLADQVSELNPTGGGTTASLASGVGNIVHGGINGSGGYYDPFGAAGAAGTFGGSGGLGGGSSGIETTDPNTFQSIVPEYGGSGAEMNFVSSGGADGLPGGNYGGGGSGAARVSGGPSRSGGAGAQGLIRLLYR